MAIGSLAAHALTYPLVAARAETGQRVSAERSSTGLASHSVLALGIIAALLGAVGVSWLVARLRGRVRPGASPWLFFSLPPLAYSLQELIERLLHAEAAPFSAVLEPRFLIGLALQIPVGLVALLVARLLLRVVHRIFRALARPRLSSVRLRSSPARLPASCALPRIPALALGYPQRGPPIA